MERFKKIGFLENPSWDAYRTSLTATDQRKRSDVVTSAASAHSMRKRVNESPLLLSWRSISSWSFPLNLYLTVLHFTFKYFSLSVCDIVAHSNH